MHWEHVHPDPSGQWLNSAAWGEPGFVVVGANEELLFSEDGLHWQRITNNTQSSAWSWYWDVCYYDGRYVALGDSGISWSTNGLSWQSVQIGPATPLYSCAGGNGMYVVSAGTNTLLVSTNAQDWEPRPAPVGFKDLVCAGDRWVAVTGGSRIYTSTNLTDWTFESMNRFAGPVLNAVCFGNGRFLACGAYAPDQPSSYTASVIYYSSNGINWTQALLGGLDASSEIKAAVFSAGLFIGINKGDFLRSTNGENWELVTGLAPNEQWQDIACSPSGTFLIVGAQGALRVSTNGQSWQPVSDRPRVEIRTVTHANNRFVAAGSGIGPILGPIGSAVVMTSTNGREWQSSLTTSDHQLVAVAYGNGLWIVSGDNGGIYTSGDAINWTNRSLPTTSQDLTQLVFGKGRFVAFAFSRDVIYHSTNGINWVSNAVPLASTISKARFLNGRFVAVGSDGLVSFSDNGTVWKNTIISPTNHFEALTYGKGRYLIGGNDVVAYSLNGTNWTMQPAPFPIRDLLYADGWFVAVGTSMRMAFSRDGVQWSAFEEPVINDELYALAYGNGVIVAGGNLSLYRSTLTDSETFKKRLRVLTPLQLELFGATGYEYRIERTTNLVDWAVATGWLKGSYQYIYWQAAPFQDSRRFWRATIRATP